MLFELLYRPLAQKLQPLVVRRKAILEIVPEHLMD
jgi:hypothetical protein